MKSTFEHGFWVGFTMALAFVAVRAGDRLESLSLKPVKSNVPKFAPREIDCDYFVIGCLDPARYFSIQTLSIKVRSWRVASITLIMPLDQKALPKKWEKPGCKFVNSTRKILNGNGR